MIPTIILDNNDLLVRIDPTHGGEVLDLIDCVNGRQLLGRPPFSAADRLSGELDRTRWIESYRGGWQLLTPNAGNSCDVEGAVHGFHGRASADRWEVGDVSASTAILNWQGHELSITREFSLDRSALEIATTFEAVSGRRPFVSVEHCALGIDILDPVVHIKLPEGLAYELSERDGPVTASAGAPIWPRVRLLDGSVERGDRWPLATPRARYHVVANVKEGNAQVVNAVTGVGLELDWATDVLPHLWIWHEVRVNEGPWRGHAEILAIEPASVPHPLGLATAIEEGQAHWVEPGSPLLQRIRARPIRDSKGSQ